jgi:hypothetical protein
VLLVARSAARSTEDGLHLLEKVRSRFWCCRLRTPLKWAQHTDVVFATIRTVSPHKDRDANRSTKLDVLSLALRNALKVKPGDTFLTR